MPVVNADIAKDPGQWSGSRRKHDSLGIEGSLQQFDLLDPSYLSSLFYRETLFSKPRDLFPFPSPFMDVVELVNEHLDLFLNAPNPSLGSFDPRLQCLHPFPLPIFPLTFIDGMANRKQIDYPTSPITILRWIQEQVEMVCCLLNLNDQVATLKLGFDWTVSSKIDASDCRYK